MRQTVSLLLLGFASALAARAASANTYYVSPTGNDNGTGAQTAPWRTLQKAANTVVAGDTVNVLAGTYAGFAMGFNSPQTGTSSAPIAFLAQSGVLINQPNSFTLDGIDLEGVSYITIRGFEVAGMGRAGIRSVSAVGGPNPTNVTLQDNNSHDNSNWGIFTSHVDSLLIENNQAWNSKNQHGIYISNACVNPTLRSNAVYGNNQNGIHMNGDKSQGGTGLIVGALISGNSSHDNGVGGGSGINCDGVQSSRFENNLLYELHASGISLYDIDGGAGSTNNVVVNNTVVVASDGRWALNIQNGSSGNTAKNNILLNNDTARGSINISSDSLPGFTSNFNVVVNRFTTNDGNTVLTLAQWQAATGQDQQSIISTPTTVFANPSANDYHLSPSSPAVDSGTSTLAPSVDFDGNSRPQGSAFDIGAYELVQGGATAPSAPTNLSATAVSSSQISLTWTDTSSNESGFQVERSLDGANFALITTLGSDTTSFTDSGLASQATYFYRVRAFNSAGSSGYSNVASATTQPSQGGAPAAPSNLTATARPGHHIALAWQDNSNNETGFGIERSLDGTGFTRIATVGTNQASTVDTGLKRGVTYFYRVQALSPAGNSAYTNVATATAH